MFNFLRTYRIVILRICIFIGLIVVAPVLLLFASIFSIVAVTSLTVLLFYAVYKYCYLEIMTAIYTARNLKVIGGHKQFNESQPCHHTHNTVVSRLARLKQAYFEARTEAGEFVISCSISLLKIGSMFTGILLLIIITLVIFAYFASTWINLVAAYTPLPGWNLPPITETLTCWQPLALVVICCFSVILFLLLIIGGIGFVLLCKDTIAIYFNNTTSRRRY